MDQIGVGECKTHLTVWWDLRMDNFRKLVRDRGGILPAAEADQSLVNAVMQGQIRGLAYDHRTAAVYSVQSGVMPPPSHSGPPSSIPAVGPMQLQPPPAQQFFQPHGGGGSGAWDGSGGGGRGGVGGMRGEGGGGGVNAWGNVDAGGARGRGGMPNGTSQAYPTESPSMNDLRLYGPAQQQSARSPRLAIQNEPRLYGPGQQPIASPPLGGVGGGGSAAVWGGTGGIIAVDAHGAKTSELGGGGVGGGFGAGPHSPEGFGGPVRAKEEQSASMRTGQVVKGPARSPTSARELDAKTVDFRSSPSRGVGGAGVSSAPPPAPALRPVVVGSPADPDIARPRIYDGSANPSMMAANKHMQQHATTRNNAQGAAASNAREQAYRSTPQAGGEPRRSPPQQQHRPREQQQQRQKQQQPLTPHDISRCGDAVDRSCLRGLPSVEQPSQSGAISSKLQAIGCSAPVDVRPADAGGGSVAQTIEAVGDHEAGYDVKPGEILAVESASEAGVGDVSPRKEFFQKAKATLHVTSKLFQAVSSAVMGKGDSDTTSAGPNPSPDAAVASSVAISSTNDDTGGSSDAKLLSPSSPGFSVAFSPPPTGRVPSVASKPPQLGVDGAPNISFGSLPAQSADTAAAMEKPVIPSTAVAPKAEEVAVAPAESRVDLATPKPTEIIAADVGVKTRAPRKAADPADDENTAATTTSNPPAVDAPSLTSKEDDGNRDPVSPAAMAGTIAIDVGARNTRLPAETTAATAAARPASSSASSPVTTSTSPTDTNSSPSTGAQDTETNFLLIHDHESLTTAVSALDDSQSAGGQSAGGDGDGSKGSNDGGGGKVGEGRGKARGLKEVLLAATGPVAIRLDGRRIGDQLGIVSTVQVNPVLFTGCE